MEGEPVRRTALWLLGGVLVFAALRLVFSYGGYELLASALQRLGIPLGPVDAWLFAALLAAGIVTVTVLCLLAVGFLAAPQQLWLSALTVSLLRLVELAHLVGMAWISGIADAGPQEQFERMLTGSPFWSSQLYLVALVGYPLGALLGCWLGQRLDSARAERQARTDTRLTRASS
jgi:hypothetical protein